MLKEKRQSLQTSFAVSFGILRKGTTEVWEYEKTAKLIKPNIIQNSCRISPSERKLALALEDKTSQRKILQKLKLKHLVGRWELRINFLCSSYVFCFIIIFRIWGNFPPFRLLGFAAIFRYSVF